jgi:predicted metal-binding transcription factor (methanogenesis marker protein 9)
MCILMPFHFQTLSETGRKTCYFYSCWIFKLILVRAKPRRITHGLVKMHKHVSEEDYKKKKKTLQPDHINSCVTLSSHIKEQ